MSDIKLNDEFENFIENNLISRETNNNKQSSKNVNNVSNVTIHANDGYKIFVGNVPYHCTQEEFDICFTNVEGFIKAEIITMHKTNMSRGFGFVTVKTLHDAELLKRRDDIIFKGRTLRFTSYQEGTYKSVNETFTNYVFVDGIPDGKNREWLKKKFHHYEPIGRCFVSMDQETGNMKNYGVIEVLDENKYKHIVTKKWHDIDGKMIETTRYKNKEQSSCQNDKKTSNVSNKFEHDVKTKDVIAKYKDFTLNRTSLFRDAGVTEKYKNQQHNQYHHNQYQQQNQHYQHQDRHKYKK